jgi:hypothetical protein
MDPKSKRRHPVLSLRISMMFFVNRGNKNDESETRNIIS